MRMLLTALTGLIVAGVVAGAARADGLPIAVPDGGLEGVPIGLTRYTALPAPGGTVVAQVQQRGGRILRARFVSGRYTIPAVALDGSPSGISADGRRLVLIRAREAFPQPITRLAIIDTRRLRVSRYLRLDGDFSFDAVSPNGRLVYLIQYVAPSDPTRYAVRVYDTVRGRLIPGPIIDPHEPDEAMRGFPLTRTTSADGRWAYTLYDGAGKHPFIHALDTSGRSARCIDLDSVTLRDLGMPRLRLDRGGSRLVLGNGPAPVAFVDVKTFAVSAPGQQRLTGATAETPVSTDEGTATALIGAAGVAVLLAAGVLSLTLRRRRRAVTT
jgi:hypothetical protein